MSRPHAPAPKAFLLSPRARRLWTLLALALLLAGATRTPAAAASTTRITTRSCVDAGGITWHTKVVWGSTYLTSAGTRKISVGYAGWTSTLGSIPTDSTVTSYDANRRPVGSLSRTATVNYQQGTVYDHRNAVNPPVGGRIVLRLGRDGDGAAGCSVTHVLPATTDTVIAAVGDMVCPPGSRVTATACQHKAVSDSILAARPSALLTLGDNVYYEGTDAQFRDAYAPSYGRLKSITSPAVGNHEYRTPGASGYFRYFGTAAGDPRKGYYSQDIGSWHVITLNSEQDISATGAQLQWLKNDLAAHPNLCTLAVTHKPRFSSGDHGNDSAMQPFAQALVAARAELFLSGHDHDYERFFPQDGTGRATSTGITQVVVGTGGKSLNGMTSASANSAVRAQISYGWLRLTLRPSSADLRFISINGAFTDQKTILCR